MTSSLIQKVGVVGAGQMGHGIAQVFAQSEFQVILTDVSEQALEKAQHAIEKSLSKMLAKGKISENEKKATLSRLDFTPSWDGLQDVDLVIEAIVEQESVKSELWQKLDKHCKPACLFASNTSSIPITRLAATTSRANQFIGMHFMNPVPIMKLVEIIPGKATDESVVATICSLAETLGKITVVSQDYPGFIVNRILMPMINEAFRALMEGVATPDDIDKGMKFGCNQPMGPLTLADFIGLDTCLAILEVLYTGLGDPRYAPCPLLRKYVEAGYLGVKTQRGVYCYDDKGGQN